MKLRTEIAELLSGFEKRMKFINIARYLTEYSYKDTIKAIIPDRDVMDNLVVAVLVFIKERTLGSEQNCTLSDVEDFLDDISSIFSEKFSVNSSELARFIVVDVLQKGGILTNYKVLIPDKERFEFVPIRLIEEEKGTYHLTDDAFDFLFRSKEIESELDYSVTRFRMAEYMKRDNYAEALNQSRELVSKIRSKQKQIAFLQEEQNELKVRIREAQENEKKFAADLETIHSRLSLFEKLLGKLEEEIIQARDLEIAEKELRDLICQQSLKNSEKEQKEIELREVLDRLKELYVLNKTLADGLANVSDAAESKIIEGKWDGLLSQYEASLSVQSADLRRMNEEKHRLIGEVAEKQKEIQKRECAREEYEVLVYSETLEAETDAERRSTEAECQAADVACTKASRAQAKAEASFENADKKLMEFGGQALPMSEVGAAFEDRIADYKKKIADNDSQIRIVAETLAKLQRIQGKAETVTGSHQRPVKYASVALETDYVAQLDVIIGKIREWKNSAVTMERKVDDSLKKMSSVYGTESVDISLAISGMQELLSNGTVRGDRYYTLCEHIDANMHTAELRISQIDTDLKEFHKTKGDLIRQCVIQGKQIYEGLIQLSGNSKVKVQEKRRRMLKFDIPDAVDENIANTAIAAEIDKGTEEIVEKMSNGAYAESEVRRIAERTVGSKRLLRRYIGAENIVLKAYKIDRNPDNSGYRTWEQTQVNNSGAEKFVVYFAVILALMAYTRDGYDDLNGKNNRSVLVLDNPFGPISSKHVLEPMFEISRNYNVQMICLSDISKSDIVSCFDLVIRAVVKQFALSSKEQLTHEGNESIEHGFYRSEQMNLFQCEK